ncbi:MAG: PASTA domain-containing protein [Ignavibacteriaceae bacterium]|nr:PASTA domain-containing protein [Ignavibacteriaceae bacterium]
MTRLELRVGRVTFQVSERLNPNTVTEQDPSPGQKAFKGDIVNLFVTKEAEETELIIEGEN